MKSTEKYIKGQCFDDEWRLFSDPERKQFIELLDGQKELPIVNAVLNERKEKGRYWGLKIVCPYCGDLHFHGDDIKKSGIMGLRVAHCGLTIMESQKQTDFNAFVIGKHYYKKGSYWINVPEKAFKIAELHKGKFFLSNNEKLLRLYSCILNGYKPTHRQVAKGRLKMEKALNNLFYKRINKKSSMDEDYFKKLDRKVFEAKNREIYFIACKELNVVKIGISNDPEKRLISLQTAFPFKLEILKTIQGNESEESDLHHRFRAHRKTGEWFNFSDEIKYYIDFLCSMNV